MDRIPGFGPVDRGSNPRGFIERKCSNAEFL